MGLEKLGDYGGKNKSLTAREKHGNSHQTVCIMSINTWAARHCPLSNTAQFPGPRSSQLVTGAFCFFTYTDRPQEIGLRAWSWSLWPAGAGAMHPSLAGPPLALLPTLACCSAHKDGPDPLPSREVSEPSSALGAVGTVSLVMLSPGLPGIRAPAWGPAVPAVVLLPLLWSKPPQLRPHTFIVIHSLCGKRLARLGTRLRARAAAVQVAAGPRCFRLSQAVGTVQLLFWL